MEVKGAKNTYHCGRCQTWIVTINVDDGVTPFTVLCESCCVQGRFGSMYSSLYRKTDLEPTHEWYRPTKGQLRKLKASLPMMQHVAAGGLILREIK